MTVRERIVRLRALIAELERLPDGPVRDALLQEARARLVAAETGELPSAAWSAPPRAKLDDRERLRLILRDRLLG